MNLPNESVFNFYEGTDPAQYSDLTGVNLNAAANALLVNQKAVVTEIERVDASIDTKISNMDASSIDGVASINDTAPSATECYSSAKMVAEATSIAQAKAGAVQEDLDTTKELVTKNIEHLSTIQTSIDDGSIGGGSVVVSSPIVTGSNTIANGIRSVSISFSATPLLVGATIVSYVIDWADGSEAVTVSGTSASYTYPSDQPNNTIIQVQVTAIDSAGNTSNATSHAMTYKDNEAPTGNITSNLPNIMYVGSHSVTFTGATDSDGTVVSYQVTDISNSKVTVSSAIVDAGSAHTFNVASNITNQGDPDVLFSFTVSAIDDKGAVGASKSVSTYAGVIPIEALFDVPGNHYWVCPAGVTSVSVACVAGGGQGAGYASGGGGGGFAYKNNIAVTPGTSYLVGVGAGGVYQDYGSGGDGGSSYFQSTDVVGASGGLGGCEYHGIGDGGSGGNILAGTGGKGGNGGNRSNDTYGGAGGGGAGGYAGAGGKGANGATGDNTSAAGSGGAGGGGGSYGGLGSNTGGGTFLYGQGASGASVTGYGAGNVGSYVSGTDLGNSSTGSKPGGGGAAGNGGNGAVRLVFGAGMSFPNSAV